MNPQERPDRGERGAPIRPCGCEQGLAHTCGIADDFLSPAAESKLDRDLEAREIARAERHDVLEPCGAPVWDPDRDAA